MVLSQRLLVKYRVIADRGPRSIHAGSDPPPLPRADGESCRSEVIKPQACSSCKCFLLPAKYFGQYRALNYSPAFRLSLLNLSVSDVASNTEDPFFPGIRTCLNPVDKHSQIIVSSILSVLSLDEQTANQAKRVERRRVL